jgi:hypothetical protein
MLLGIAEAGGLSPSRAGDCSLPGFVSNCLRRSSDAVDGLGTPGVMVRKAGISRSHGIAVAFVPRGFGPALLLDFVN